MRFCRAELRRRWLASTGSIQAIIVPESPSTSSMLASSTSMESSERLSAASAPATKRVAWAA